MVKNMAEMTAAFFRDTSTALSFEIVSNHLSLAALINMKLA